MNKLVFLSGIVMVLLCMTSALVLADRPSVAVTSFSVVDGNATVGSDFILLLTLTNTQPNTCAKVITTSIQAGAPFIMRGLSMAPSKDLCNSGSTTVGFPMKIDPTAVGGFYQLVVTSNYETPTLAQFTTTTTLNLLVDGSPDILANIVSSNPIDVYPGDTAAVSVAIQNDGGFPAQSVNAQLTADSPLVVAWSQSLAALGQLSAKQRQTAVFSVEIPKDADAKDYPMVLTIDYLDQNMARQTKFFNLVFHVKPVAMFTTADAGSDSLYANENSLAVKLSLRNTGTDAAKNIKVKILPQYPFSTDGSVRYIDVLQPGQQIPVQFTVNVDKDGTPGDYGLDMLVDFEDAEGKSLQDTTVVTLNVQPKGALRAIFVDYWFAWVLAVGAAAFVVVTRRRPSAKKG